MDATVIVALAAVDDKVHRISSEKVPHLTLVYMSSEGLDLQSVVEFVQHASRQLNPFGLIADYRGTLGADDADVVFFDERSGGIDDVKAFRSQLLQNDAIRLGYDNAEQFPKWTPHLTLGYPETPAHKDTDEDPGIRYVNFDRIAVWTEDSEGPEFRLSYESNELEVTMSDIQTTLALGEKSAAELFHYGVKGMKWGVTTKSGSPQVTQTREKKALRNAKDVKVTQRKAGTYVKTRGGQRQKATNDAIKAQAGRQKAKKSTTDALTNKELKDTIERMRLEQEFSKLNKKVSRRGNGLVSQILRSPIARQKAENLLKKAA